MWLNNHLSFTNRQEGVILVGGVEETLHVRRLHCNDGAAASAAIIMTVTAKHRQVREWERFSLSERAVKEAGDQWLVILGCKRVEQRAQF